MNGCWILSSALFGNWHGMLQKVMGYRGLWLCLWCWHPIFEYSSLACFACKSAVPEKAANGSPCYLNSATHVGDLHGFSAFLHQIDRALVFEGIGEWASRWKNLLIVTLLIKWILYKWFSTSIEIVMFWFIVLKWFFASLILYNEQLLYPSCKLHIIFTDYKIWLCSVIVINDVHLKSIKLLNIFSYLLLHRNKISFFLFGLF